MSIDNIIKAKKYLTIKGYNLDGRFNGYKVAELMAEWLDENTNKKPLGCPKCDSVSMFKSALYWNCNKCENSWIED